MLKHDHCLPAKQIICILERGQSKVILDKLHAMDHVIAAEFLAVRNQHVLMAGQDWVEMDLLRALVLPQYADNVFEVIYKMAQVETQEGVYLFQHNVPWMTHFELPKLPESGLNLAEILRTKTLPEGMTMQQLQDLKKLSSLK